MRFFFLCKAGVESSLRILALLNCAASLMFSRTRCPGIVLVFAGLSLLALVQWLSGTLRGHHVHEARELGMRHARQATPRHKTNAFHSSHTRKRTKDLRMELASASTAVQEPRRGSSAFGEGISNLRSRDQRRSISVESAQELEFAKRSNDPLAFGQVVSKVQAQRRKSEKDAFNAKMKKLLDQHRSKTESIKDYEKSIPQFHQLLKSLPAEQQATQIAKALRKSQRKVPTQRLAAEKEREKIEKSMNNLRIKWEAKRLREERGASREDPTKQVKTLQRRESHPTGTLALLDSQDPDSPEAQRPKAGAASLRTWMDKPKPESANRPAHEAAFSFKPAGSRAQGSFSFRLPGSDAGVITPRLNTHSDDLEKATSSEDNGPRLKQQGGSIHGSEHVHGSEDQGTSKPESRGPRTQEFVEHPYAQSKGDKEPEEFADIKSLAKHMRSRERNRDKWGVLRHLSSEVAKGRALTPKEMKTSKGLHRRSSEHAEPLSPKGLRADTNHEREGLGRTEKDESQSESTASMLDRDTNGGRGVKRGPRHLRPRSMQIGPQHPADSPDAYPHRTSHDGFEALSPVQSARFAEAARAHASATQTLDEAHNRELEHNAHMALAFGDRRRGAEWSRLHARKRKLRKDRVRAQRELRRVEGAMRRARGRSEPPAAHHLQRRTLGAPHDRGGPLARSSSTGEPLDAAHQTILLAHDHVRRATHDYQEAMQWSNRARCRLGSLRDYVAAWRRQVPWRLRTRARAHAVKMEWYCRINQIEATVEAAAHAEKLARERREQAHDGGRIPPHVLGQVPVGGVERYPSETIDGRRDMGGGPLLAVSRSAS